jgi:hypothetical protein
MSHLGLKKINWAMSAVLPTDDDVLEILSGMVEPDEAVEARLGMCSLDVLEVDVDSSSVSLSLSSSYSSKSKYLLI